MKLNIIGLENLSDNSESRFTRIFWKIFDSTADSEIQRRVVLLVGLSVIGIAMLFGFSIAAFIQNNKPLFTIDIISAFILLLNLIDAKRRKKYDFNIFLGVSLVSFLYLTLYAFGGTKNTAFVWYFTYPLIAFYLLGSKQGGIVSLLMTLPVLLLMIGNKNSSIFANYNFDFEIRFLFSYLVVVSFSYLFEKTRENNYKELKYANLSLEKEVEKRTSELNLTNKNLIREIEERKKIADAIHLSNESLLTILNSIDATIYVADIDTYEIIFMNKYMIESFGRDMTGETCWKAFRENEAPCVDCPNDKIIDENRNPKGVYSWQGENPVAGRWYINKDRAVRWIDGRVVHLQVAADITNIKELEERLQQAQKMESIGTLAGGIAHDFNNVLYSIIGYTELTMDDVPEGSLAQKNLKEVFKGAMRAKDMVQQILAFSRKADTEKKPIKVQSVVKEALKLLRTSIPSTIKIRQNIDADYGPVLADPTQIHQVVMNLATNAYQAMREKGGVLELTIMEEEIGSDDSESHLDLNPGTYLKLTVSDTGHGIDKEVIEKIYDPYFTTSGPGEGTGMGLAVVHGIVKSHGGNIKVYSELGEGTVFHIYLPLIETRPGEPKTITAEPAQTGTERILLVDDEEAIVFMTQQTLERLGYQVTSRTSSVEALEAFKAKPDEYDLVITDMTMPNMTGVELASRLKEIRSDIPIIICTGFSEVIDKDKAKKRGILAYIMKPILKDEIARTIRKVLDEEKEK